MEGDIVQGRLDMRRRRAMTFVAASLMSGISSLLIADARSQDRTHSVSSSVPAPRPASAAVRAAPPVVVAPDLPPAPTSGERWQPGLDYIAVIPSQKTEVPAGKVEVDIYILYTAPVAVRFAPVLADWEKTKPAYIEIVRKPDVRFPHSRPQARIYYTLQKLGRADLEPALLKWIWDPKHYDIYHNLIFPDVHAIDDLNVEFAKQSRVDEKLFREAYFSKDMDQKLIEEQLRLFSVGGSAVVVNGRYGSDLMRIARRDLAKAGRPEDFQRMFQLIEYLAAAELARK
jgi:hypothetical protein